MHHGNIYRRVGRESTGILILAIQHVNDLNHCNFTFSLTGFAVIIPAMQKHQWREDTDEGKMLYRATYHAGGWKLYSQLKGELDWLQYDPIPVALLEKLREVIWNKYQRGRCPHKLVAGIDKMLGKVD